MSGKKMEVKVYMDYANIGDPDSRKEYLFESSNREGANMLKRLAESIKASSSHALEVVGHDKRNGRLRVKFQI